MYEYFLGEFAYAEGKKCGQFYTPEPWSPCSSRTTVKSTNPAVAVGVIWICRRFGITRQCLCLMVFLRNGRGAHDSWPVNQELQGHPRAAESAAGGFSCAGRTERCGEDNLP
ncbi:N-6 DNA methylase [Aeromonas caviae]|uniref:N-6 DNA methylase n=1 Tax=Aeromonas caviae TaxID=648 RepID=UPI002250CCB2|nr:N-6 DNA methylase [Aeromonas caviae]MCX4036445.1 N-6 DNA methylase [Aeromonas caviae]